MDPYKIRPLLKEDLPELKEFTDRAIGHGYYTLSELEDIYERSLTEHQKMMTLVLLIDHKIQGVRITFPPGHWEKGKGRGLSIKSWPHPLKETAYFQSLFIDPKLSGQGFGKKLSLRAIEALKIIGAKGVVCHSWKESPHDSSGKYLRSLGFKLIATHPNYWKEVDYECTRCGKPCLCTAEEMYLNFTKDSP